MERGKAKIKKGNEAGRDCLYDVVLFHWLLSTLI